MSNIKVTDLDFDILKENLKDFLRGQEEFQDYDFDGSGLQILLDILSANTHYNAIYQNMVANEMFLDSAVLRESVVSRAKALGYVPSSLKSSQIDVTLRVVETSATNIQPVSVALPAYSNFSATKDGVTYIFQNPTGQTLSDSGSTDGSGRKIYTGTFTVKQGVAVEQNFTVNFQSNPDQRFIISNSNVDISSLVVSVNQTPQDQTATYAVSTTAENVVEIGNTDNVYWVNENESGNYEIYFGNGRIGKKLSDGAAIKVQYLTTSGAVGNNISEGFSFGDTIVTSNSSYTQYDISKSSTATSSFGGADKETVEEIRFTSPKFYEMQNRSVTALDYKFLIQKKYQNVDSIKTWGGEDNDPVYYGRVFISLKPKTGFFITETAKKNIINDIIKEYNVVTIDAEIVEPVFTFVELDTEVKYNLREVPQGEEHLKNQILSSISTFNTDNLGKFDSYFRYSQLTTKIDTTSDAVKSNVTSIKLQNRLVVSLGVSSSYTSTFNNEILAGTLESSKFTYDGNIDSFLKDDSNGNISIFTFSGDTELQIVSNIGTIDYNKGSISLNGFIPTTISSGDDYIKLKAQPRSNDLSPLRNQILSIDESTININMNNISEQFLTQNQF